MTYLGNSSGQVIRPDLRQNRIDLLGQDANVSMHLDERNTMVFCVFLFLSCFKSYSQKGGSYRKETFFLFDLPWEGQNMI